MKKIVLEKTLRKFGWYFERAGGNHDIWSNGNIKQPIPRHREINEYTARSIIKVAAENPIIHEE
ncbi:MAG: type II toxin-antitoxin system HicA family toxin [Parachlamydiales bacterium]|nr:type II toxin-antitoxin system HicA family toxin [Parachlamydiales bacterium]